VTDPELPKLLEAIYGVPAPEGPRNDLVEIFLTGIAKGAPTLDGSPAPIQADLNSHVLNVDKDQIQPAEMLRLNTSIKPAEKADRLGVLAGDLQGFPNGRRLGDDVSTSRSRPSRVPPRPASWSTRWLPGTRWIPTTSSSPRSSRTSRCPAR
jgi:hypothetical protein